MVLQAGDNDYNVEQEVVVEPKAVILFPAGVECILPTVSAFLL